jgi:hypothetical protein
MQRLNFRNIPRLTGVFISIVFLSGLTSCALDRNTYKLYQGPQLPDDETAQIICTGERIQINSVNGQKSPDGKDTFGNVRIEILPGDYNLTVSFSGWSLVMVHGKEGQSRGETIYYRHNSLNNVDIRINAQAGHIYVVNSSHNYETSRWYIILTDKSDDRSILKEGPYPLTKVRTSDNLQERFRFQD